MTFTFQPLTDEEIEQSRQTLQEGIGKFKILTGEEAVSKAGNPMIVLNMEVWDKSGNSQHRKAWLVCTNAMMWKVKQFCQSIKKVEWYQSGKIEIDLLPGKSGECMLKKNGKFIEIEEFLPPSEPNVPSAAPDREIDDDLPF